METIEQLRTQLAAAQSEVGRLTKERDERWTELDCSYVNMVQKLSSLVRSILVSYERGASQDVWPKVEEMRDWMELKHPYVADLKRLVDDHETRIDQLATLRRERDEAQQLLADMTQDRDKAIGELRAVEVERDELRYDKERLDWLEAQSAPSLPWVARKSTTGRGYRLHQDPTGPGFGSARAALDSARAKQGEGHPEDAKEGERK